MDFAQIAQIALWGLSLVSVLLGWFARQIWNAVQELKKEIGDVRILMGTEYVRYDRLQDALKPVMDSLHEIKLTLAGKADK